MKCIHSHLEESNYILHISEMSKTFIGIKNKQLKAAAWGKKRSSSLFKFVCCAQGCWFKWAAAQLSVTWVMAENDGQVAAAWLVNEAVWLCFYPLESLIAETFVVPRLL